MASSSQTVNVITVWLIPTHQIQVTSLSSCMILEIFQESCGVAAVAHEEVALHAGSPAGLLLEIGSST